MSEEELVFQEERKARTRRIVEEKKIATEDCLVIGVLRLNREIGALYEKMEEMEERMGSNFRWIVGLGMWATMIAAFFAIGL